MAFVNVKAALSGLAAAAAMAVPALADVNIGYLSDMSGPTSVLTGESSQRAIEMAIADFGGEVNGEKIVLTVADHLSKPDVGLGIAREWVDKGDIDLLFSVDQSAVALAVSDLVRDKNITFLHGASSAALTNEKCGPYQVQMILDTYGLSRAISMPLVATGHKKWYYISVDYALGHDLQAKGEAAVAAAGGEIVGSARHSPQTTDFSAFLLEAQSRGADTIGLATFGSWQIAVAKQAQEFGLSIPLAPYFLGDTDIKAAGLDSLQNVSSAIPFYWDQNDKTRAFARRYQERYNRPPTFPNAMHYEFISHYLNAVKAVGSTDAAAVVAKMRETPIRMINGDTATIRADGRTLRPMYSFVTKTPAESSGDWDFLKITGTIPADTLAPPLSESKCPLVKG
ncbi:ABC transporter substrate-binding protein [Kumtagia ephedrae]|uniref:ABC transporter permease n=1 Tax=Kumtagia ephedrae TaxID=2116701 RepID=A0A2P7S5J4_9HYPH|nr:ABC transporter substrate-binding protein [Mesorhizobium ephedrae]PSJ57754.1 ABC transporter permease [Mesorhizobium ephedrae]